MKFFCCENAMKQRVEKKTKNIVRMIKCRESSGLIGKLEKSIYNDIRQKGGLLIKRKSLTANNSADH